MGFMELKWECGSPCSAAPLKGAEAFFVLYKVKEKMKQLFKISPVLFELLCWGSLSITPGSALPAPALG